LWLLALFAPTSQLTSHLLGSQIGFCLNLALCSGHKHAPTTPLIPSYNFLHTVVLEKKYHAEIATDFRKSSILMAVLIPVPHHFKCSKHKENCFHI